MCLKLEGLRPLDKVLRFAVETNAATLEVTSVSIVEVDNAGNPVQVYHIPLGQRQDRRVTVLQARPIELTPPLVEPLAKIEEIAEPETHGTKTKNDKADTGTQ